MGLPVSQHRVGAGPLFGGLPPELRGLRTAAGGGCWQLETAVVLLLLHGGATVAEEGGGELSAADNWNKQIMKYVNANLYFLAVWVQILIAHSQFYLNIPIKIIVLSENIRRLRFFQFLVLEMFRLQTES